jgi:hypothetical protein
MAGDVAGLELCLQLKLLSNNAVYIQGLTSFTMIRVQKFHFKPQTDEMIFGLLILSFMALQ